MTRLTDWFPSPRTIVVTVVVACTLCWPALINGQPFFSLDTVAYLRAASRGAAALLSVETTWRSAPIAGHPAPVTQHSTSVGTSAPVPTENPVLAARSIYYGLLLLAAHAMGSLWLCVLAQAAIVAAGIALTMHLAAPSARVSIALLALTISTPIAFFVSYLMPDVLAAVAILACANLIVFSHRMRLAHLVLWFVALTYALTVHASHLLIAMALTSCGLPWMIGQPAARWRLGLSMLVGAVALAVLAEMAFAAIVEKTTGSTPIRPPFAMARMIEDGPGARYLQDTCPDSGFAACAYSMRMPMRADAFLWDKNPDTGAFSAADAEMRRRLAAEQLKFVWRVLLFDPAGQIWASLRNWGLQLASFGLPEFNYDLTLRSAFSIAIPDDVLTKMRGTLAYAQSMPTRLPTILYYATFLLSLAYFVVNFVRERNGLDAAHHEFRVFTTLVIAGVLINAAICGALSSPHDRYQARVAWLVPFLLVLDILRRRSALQSRSNRALMTPQGNSGAQDADGTGI